MSRLVCLLSLVLVGCPSLPDADTGTYYTESGNWSHADHDGGRDTGTTGTDIHGGAYAMDTGAETPGFGAVVQRWVAAIDEWAKP